MSNREIHKTGAMMEDDLKAVHRSLRSRVFLAVTMVFLGAMILIGASGALVYLGFHMGKAPWVESGTLKCEYTFPLLETRIEP